MTAKQLFKAFILIVSSALLFSCNQDPIFYNISNETAPAESLIPGTPNSFAEYDGELYLTNRDNIWTLNGTDWERVSVAGMQAGSSIEELVSDGTNLYARVVWDEGFVNLQTYNKVYRLTDSEAGLTATAIANNLAEDYPLINRISMANGTLVASVKRRGISGGIRYVYLVGDTLSAFGGTTDLPESSAIVATAWGGTNYFFATGRGVYYGAFDETALTLVENTSGVEINGIRTLGSSLLAWGHNENIYHITDGETPAITVINMGSRLEMANTIYNNGTFIALLIAYNYSATANGYRELALNIDGSLPDSFSLATPGEADESSTIDEAQYSSSMGRYQVYGLKQWQIGTHKVLFAGTEMGLYYSVDRGNWKIWSSGTHSEFN